ncbi:hypothetical protein BKA65DRAFT_487615 [Rhexocercosporidium sp. MPI-PUGE-AT-0058]|nr:hypothetical protein BKA65DRAFT_487615 [Rhexocercosporidium sp. MPI-PUGE-AT-0058]
MGNGRREQQSRHGNSIASRSNWSQWYFDDAGQGSRWRINSAGIRVYQYRQDGQVLSEPRSFGEFGSLAQNITPSDDTRQDPTPESSGIDHYEQLQTYRPIDSLYQNFESSSLSDSYTYSPPDADGVTDRSNDSQGSRPITISRNPVAPNPRATEFQPMARGSGYVTSPESRVREGVPAYVQSPQDQYHEYSLGESRADADEDHLVSSSMETVVPTDWRRMGGRISIENTHASMLQFARTNAPSPLQNESYNMPSGSQGSSQQFVPDVQEGPQYVSQDTSSNNGGSRDKTPQPAKDVHKNILTLEPEQSKERLDPEFKVHPSSFFKPGRVFKVLWAEPEGNTVNSSATSITDYTLQTRFDGENVYTSIRRFVIVAADQGHCQCLPILTYKRYATLKNGVKADHHAIVHMGDPAPKPLPGESLSLKPIKIKAKTPRDRLKPQSRINYAKIYTVEHNVKVLFIGEVSRSSRRTFMTDFDQVWDQKRKMTY